MLKPPCFYIHPLTVGGNVFKYVHVHDGEHISCQAFDCTLFKREPLQTTSNKEKCQAHTSH